MHVELMELDGRISGALAIQEGRDGRYEVKLSLPRFGIRTLRCEMHASNV
jgi:hypothetical protein